MALMTRDSVLDSGALSGGMGNIEIFENKCFEEEKSFSLLNFLMREFDLEKPVVLKGESAVASAAFLFEHYSLNNNRIDLLNLDEEALRGDTSSIEKLYGLMSLKGLICIDTKGDSLSPELFPDVGFEPVLVTSHLSIFARSNGQRSTRSICYQIDLFRRKLFFNSKNQELCSESVDTPLVTVVVLTYKHETYIADSLRSVLCQQGRFRMRIIIIDDASPDGTAQVVRSVIEGCQDERIEFEFLANKRNAGVVANLATATRLATGCDYLTFCEGDDFWSSEFRIQEHIDFLRDHPQSVMSFNSIELCDANGSSRELVEHASLVTETIEGAQLAEDNVIGNFTACFYRGALLEVIPQEIFKIYTVDWFFNIYCAQFGSVGHLKKPLSVYRQHEGGEWSARKGLDKATALLGLIDQYNAFIDYSYDEGFRKYSGRLYSWLNAVHSESFEKFDLIAIDDTFPSRSNQSVRIELTSYLAAFPRSLILATGAGLQSIEGAPIKDIVRAYQRSFPELGNRVMMFNDQFPLGLGKVLYANTLSSVYSFLLQAEAIGVPFVFTLGSDTGFELNNPEYDKKLKRVFESTCFQRVIVSQSVVYGYLMAKRLCPLGKVDFIFGSVMPLESTSEVAVEKSRWGYGKSRLDICFMTDKYSLETTGYDVFVNVASILRQRYEDIYFHVVGPFDQSAIDVSAIADRVAFYSPIKPEHLDGFFEEVDIILAPNLNGDSLDTSFGGFPAFGCTEAGLRGVSIFAIDEYNSADGRFMDEENIVLIKYDLWDIAGKIEKYYKNPEALKLLGECTSQRVRLLYSTDAQIAPRIEVLRQALESPVVPLPCGDPTLVPGNPLPVNTVDSEKVNADVLKIHAPFLWKVLRRIFPELLKKLYRVWKSNHVS